MSFPAKLTGINGFEADAQTEVSERVAKLVETVGKKFLVTGNDDNTGSTVQIELVAELTDKTSEETENSHVDSTTVWIPNPGARGIVNKNRIAGRATRYGNECLVQISRFVVDYGDELLQPVLWHELGHCAGLEHESVPDKLMSPVTYPLSHYSEAEIADFIKKLLAAIG